MSQGKFQPPRRVDPPPSAGRVPPHDLDAEAAVLSAILLEGRDALERVRDVLKPERFYSEANGRIFQAAQQLAMDLTPIDMVSVASWLRDREWLAKMGGTAYLAQLADATPSVGHVAAHAKVVYEKWRVRQIIATCQRVAAEGYGDVGEPQGFIDGAVAGIAAIATNDNAAGAESVPVIARRVAEAITASEKAREQGQEEDRVVTGMYDLDRLAGPLRPSLIIIAAWQGIGKSSLMREWAIRMATRKTKKRGVIIFSLEMSRDEMVMALAYSIAGVDSAKLDAYEKLSAEDWKSLGDAFKVLSNWHWFWIEDQETLTNKSHQHIEARVRQIQRGHAKALDVEIASVMVDYLQLMDGREGLEKGANREREISNIAYGLQGMSQRLKLPVIALSQLNEDGKKRKDGRPCAEDSRESKAIAQAAHRMILIHNPHYIERRRAMQEQRGSYRAPDHEDVELIVDKNRGGRTGIVPVRFLPWCTSFEDMPAADG